MRQLSRYTGRVVLGAILLVLLVILALNVIGAIADGLGDLRNQYDFPELLLYIGATLPERVYESLPFAVLIGALLGLGSLAGNSELVVMRAAGVSLLRIAGFAARPVLLVILVGGLLGEFVIPQAGQWAESRRMALRGEQESFSARSGVWNREGDEFMHFNAVYPDGRLAGVARYRFDDQRRLLEASFAARARFEGDHWVEEEGVISRLGEDAVTTERFATRRWDTGLAPDLVTLTLMPPEALPVRELHGYATYLESQGLRSGAYWLALWTKVLQPAVIFSLLLIAVSFVFGPLRESTTGLRVFSGVVVGILFQTSLNLLGPSSLVFGFSPFWAVAAPVLGCLAVGLVLLRRAA
ncbi:MAG: LPS export ABC transporter permease LptG [Pseudomonadota bacterium]|jgi:lipopolysaccharide export system permease protein